MDCWNCQSRMKQLYTVTIMVAGTKMRIQLCADCKKLKKS